MHRQEEQINNVIFPTVLYEDNDISRNVSIEGQKFIDRNNNQLFINFNDTDNNWMEIRDHQLQGKVFRVGTSSLLGNIVPQIIYHDMNRIPNFVNLTILDKDKIDIGCVYLVHRDSKKIGIANTGKDRALFCWFMV